MQRINISSGAPWEAVVGYSRVVRMGQLVFVTGTTAVREGVVQHPNDMYAQTKLCLDIIERYLKEAGATMADVVRTRIFVTDISQWQACGRAHGEVFANILPCTTMVQVSALIDPAMLVEIEADAVLP